MPRLTNAAEIRQPDQTAAGRTTPVAVRPARPPVRFIGTVVPLTRTAERMTRTAVRCPRTIVPFIRAFVRADHTDVQHNRTVAATRAGKE